jgi:hypothetical protein
MATFLEISIKQNRLMHLFLLIERFQVFPTPWSSFSASLDLAVTKPQFHWKHQS